jgi:hypothetical protein
MIKQDAIVWHDFSFVLKPKCLGKIAVCKKISSFELTRNQFNDRKRHHSRKKGTHSSWN